MAKEIKIPKDIKADAKRLYPPTPVKIDKDLTLDTNILKRKEYIKGRLDERAVRDRLLEAAWNASKTRDSFNDWLRDINKLNTYYAKKQRNEEKKSAR